MLRSARASVSHPAIRALVRIASACQIAFCGACRLVPGQSVTPRNTCPANEASRTPSMGWIGPRLAGPRSPPGLADGRWACLQGPRWVSRQDGGHAKLNDGGAAAGAAPVELGELVVGAGEADLQAFDLAEPAFALGFGDAVKQVVADLLQARALGRVGPQHRASD